MHTACVFPADLSFFLMNRMKIELNVCDMDPNNLTRQLWNRLKLQSEHLKASTMYL